MKKISIIVITLLTLLGTSLALGLNSKILPINIRSTYTYTCIVSDPSGKKVTQNEPKLYNESNEITPIEKIQGGKDANNVYFCFGTKKLIGADPKSFVEINIPGNGNEPILFKDNRNIYLISQNFNNGANGVSYYKIKTYPRVHASTFSCFLGDGIRMYCKDKDRVYLLVRTNRGYSHTSSSSSFKLVNTNLDLKLLKFGKNIHETTYNNVLLYDKDSNFYNTYDTGQMIDLNSQLYDIFPRNWITSAVGYDLGPIPHTILFK